MADLEVERLDGYAKASGWGICIGLLLLIAAAVSAFWWGWRSLFLAGQVLVVSLVWQMLVIVADLRSERRRRSVETT